MTTDTTEKGLETLIMRHMTGIDGFSITPGAGGKNPSLLGRATLPVALKILTARMRWMCRNYLRFCSLHNPMLTRSLQWRMRVTLRTSIDSSSWRVFLPRLENAASSM